MRPAGAVGGSPFARAVCSSAYTVLSQRDFEGGKAPHVAYVYVVLVFMRASNWLAEAERVVLRGERWSRMLDRPVSLGYSIVLGNMLPVARAAVAAGRADEELEGAYVGQELKGVLTDARFDRVRQAGTLRGSGNVGEVILAVGRGPKKVLCMPLGRARMVYRVLCYLPPVQRLVNAAEAFFTFLFSHIPGVVLFNDSPGGLDGERYLDACGDNAATVEADVRDFTERSGGVRMLQRMSVSSVPPSWLRRALNGVHYLLVVGQLKAQGAVVPPDLPGGSYSVLPGSDGRQRAHAGTYRLVVHGLQLLVARLLVPAPGVGRAAARRGGPARGGGRLHAHHVPSAHRPGHDAAAACAYQSRGARARARGGGGGGRRGRGAA